MVQLGKWYPATILVVMFAAIAVGWDRIPKKWERWVMVGPLLTAVIGFPYVGILNGPVEAGHDRLGQVDARKGRMFDFGGDQLVAACCREVGIRVR